MSNEIIGRVHNIGFGKESTAGTAVSATGWFPKTSGQFTPRFTVVRDPSSFGTIDAVKQAQTTLSWTEVELEGIAHDVFLGNLLLAAFGLEYSCIKFGISGITGTFVEGETITETTSGATGVLRRTDQSAGTPALYISVTAGTFTGGQTLTGGTSAATATGGTIESPSAVRTHIFRRANTNSHQSYTLYGKDLVGDERAAYCLLDTLEIDCVVGEYVTFTAKFMGKQLSSTTSTASYTSQNPFLAKAASCKHASAHNSLDAATAIAVRRFHLVIEKNVEAYNAFGSVSPTSLHNKQFLVRGDMELLYNETTTRDYLTNSTNKAMRLTVTNPTTIGAAAVPTLQFDMPVVAFEEWERKPENDDLVVQTVGFVATFDTTRSLSVEALLQNATVTSY